MIRVQDCDDPALWREVTKEEAERLVAGRLAGPCIICTGESPGWEVLHPTGGRRLEDVVEVLDAGRECDEAVEVRRGV